MAVTGLFLGAGVSLESGMPLVWDLSAEIRAWLTPDKLRELNRGWRAQGSGNPDEVIDALVASLLDNAMHYENILGNLEVHFNRPTPAAKGHLRQSYHTLYSWFVELVYHLLWHRHVRNESFIARSLRYLEGIAGLARQNEPLWIFSLNHDSIVECVAAHYGVRLDCGFSGTARLPLRDATGKKIGELPIDTLGTDRLEKSGFDFRNLSQPGINLIKMHGSLDVFTANDGRELVKLAPLGFGVNGVLESLRAAGENLIYVVPGYQNGKVKAPQRDHVRRRNRRDAVSEKDHLIRRVQIRPSLHASAATFDPRSVPNPSEQGLASGLHRLRLRRRPHQSDIARMAGVQRRPQARAGGARNEGLPAVRRARRQPGHPEGRVCDGLSRTLRPNATDAA